VPIAWEDAGTALRELLAARPGGVAEVDGSLAVEVGSRRLYLEALMFGPDAAAIKVMAPLVAGLADSDELCEAIATAELDFGRLLLIEGGSGARRVELVVRFPADLLCEDVLEHALATAAAEADRWDPELEARFGATWTLEGPA
jgi:hypothetical protein